MGAFDEVEEAGVMLIADIDGRAEASSRGLGSCGVEGWEVGVDDVSSS